MYIQHRNHRSSHRIPRIIRIPRIPRSRNIHRSRISRTLASLRRKSINSPPTLVPSSSRSEVSVVIVQSSSSTVAHRPTSSVATSCRVTPSRLRHSTHMRVSHSPMGVNSRLAAPSCQPRRRLVPTPIISISSSSHSSVTTPYSVCRGSITITRQWIGRSNKSHLLTITCIGMCSVAHSHRR